MISGNLPGVKNVVKRWLQDCCRKYWIETHKWLAFLTEGVGGWGSGQRTSIRYMVSTFFSFCFCFFLSLLYLMGMLTALYWDAPPPTQVSVRTKDARTVTAQPNFLVLICYQYNWELLTTFGRQINTDTLWHRKPSFFNEPLTFLQWTADLSLRIVMSEFSTRAGTHFGNCLQGRVSRKSRKAINKTPIRFFCKSGLFIYCKRNKN